jgi:nicotinate-nucleotide--dimethylbenzimidazole phosphoribosyltransferase
MSLDGYHSILVLGGIRSGKSEFAESLVNDAVEVRYVATATTPAPEDPEWAARLDEHRRRRPATWTTEETGAAPARLVALLGEAKPDQTLLIDDLGGWLTALLEEGGWVAGTQRQGVADLVGAVRDCAGRVVVVSPEVGMSVVAPTESGRAFADAMGTANRLLAQACDAVVLVVAGQPAWLKPAAPGAPAAPAAPAAPGARAAIVAPATIGSPAAVVTPAAIGAPAGPTVPGEPLTAPLAPAGPAEPAVPGPAAVDTDAGTGSAGTQQATPADATTGDTSTGEISAVADAAGTGTGVDPLSGSILSLKEMPHGLVVTLGTDLPLPDEAATTAAGDRIDELSLTGPGLGNLARAVTFAAGAQGTGRPQPFGSVRVLLLHGDHAGGVAGGDDPQVWAARAQQAAQGAGPLGLLATQVGARLQVVYLGDVGGQPVGQPIESGPALTPEQVDAALRHGLRLADEAADEGADLLVLAAAGAGQQATAAAVVAANSTTEVAALLPRVHQAGGVIDDESWMVRCGAIRDAMRGLRGKSRDARFVLSTLAGADIAVAVGVLVGAAARRLPVMIDGPVGIAAAVTARDISAATRHWTLLAEHGNHPTVKVGADVLGLEPLLDLRLGLGEGTTALAALPLVQSALTIVSSA